MTYHLELNDDAIAMLDAMRQKIKGLETQITAAQAQVKMLREALEHCLADGDFDTDDARVSFKQGLEALAQTEGGADVTQNTPLEAD